ncbi:MAG: ATP phosphoribosyltransferase regulatory subunit [Candidatus Pelagibacterales bacterium]|jgi:ATP phosphoribosyltransferase regulatory subunit|tara:strand:+ start:3583 stop:4710 length:1128 start_codon:yes stop_codon:yes gene_type:complete
MPNSQSIQDLNNKFKEFFLLEGFEYIEPPLVVKSDIYFETSGEQIRKDMFSVASTQETEMCLRPDLTIPTCQTYLKNNQKFEQAKLCYSGPIFRSGSINNSIELNQSGVEIIKTNSTKDNNYEEEVKIINLAIKTLKYVKKDSIEINLGNIAIFIEFLNCLDLPQRWKDRLRRHFFRRDYFESLLKRIELGIGFNETRKEDLLKTHLGIDAGTSDNILKKYLVNINPIEFGERSIEDIINRLNIKSETIVSSENGLKIVKIIREFLSIDCRLEKLPDAVSNFTKQKVDNSFDSVAQMALDFSNKIRLGIGNQDVNFKTDFGHSIEYYDGIMFEIKDKNNMNNKIVVGGRYDSLLINLGLENNASAIGFAVNNNNI